MFSSVGRLFLNDSGVATVQIGPPVYLYLEGPPPQETEGHDLSPDLRQYGVPDNATAALLLVKNKVKTHNGYSTLCDGEASFGVYKPGTQANGVVSYARAFKPPGITEVATETIAHNTVPVPLVDGRFAFYYYVRVGSGIWQVERAVFLAGYYLP